MKKNGCFECRTEGTLIELGKCDSDITRPDTGAAQRLRLESVKQTKIRVLVQTKDVSASLVRIFLLL